MTSIWPLRLWQIRAQLIAVLFCLSTSGLLAQNGSQFKDWSPDALVDPLSAQPHVLCRALTSLTAFEYSVSIAKLVPASGEFPEYCQILGQILPEVRFELDLPSIWNGRLYMFGNGGFAGEAFDAPARVDRRQRALLRGFAVVSTNTGHDASTEPLATFATDPQKLIDYAYRAVHVTALIAKRIIDSYYGQMPLRSYFDGCSTGGRQGLISAQRFPDDFDGIVVGAPISDFSTMTSYAWNQKTLAAAPIDAEKLKVVADKVYAKCDSVDGLRDGLIGDPRRCPFKPSIDLPKCAGDVDGPACFTTSQIRALELIYGGTKSREKQLFPGQLPGAEVAVPADGVARSGWVGWQIPGPGSEGVEQLFGQTFMRYMAFGKPEPNYDWLTFNFETDPERMQSVLGILNATDPDLSRFKKRGGKIVMYFGWADPALNPLMGVQYYESVSEALGNSTPDFFRLFMVPGMFHCGGGVGVSTFDALTPLIAWVEKNRPPANIIGSRLIEDKVVRTRPLCPYPQVAKYKGSGSIEIASSFTCTNP